MQASEIRQRFLDYFAANGHAIRPSGSLVPGDDPTLLFANAGMVQFKKIFLGQERAEFGNRATTSQKCVRAGGKHNDLEQVGHTARHQTFFEMLGNFSFGDYFKRDAIRFAWDFLTKELKLDPAHLRVSVFREDEEARALWREIAGLPDSRIYGLGAHDNFWQMADTGPCGPCSEIFTDLAHVTDDYRFPDGAAGEWTERDRTEFSQETFVEGTEAGRFLEFWNLVFMQFDRQEDGTLVPLPKPSVDTGMGLERITGVLQRVENNFHTDVFLPLLQSIEAAAGVSYRGRESNEAAWQGLKLSTRAGWSAAVKKGGRVLVEPAAFRVIADHSRAVAFLLADGVFPSNEGRGYVLRRILRRAVRHAWLLGRATPMLVSIVDRVIELMGDTYPELRARKRHILDTTLAEEQRFLATIDGGMRRFDEIAPAETTHGSDAVRGTISGEDAFRLYDTFGFPIDLTELMARERGYTVDIAGFEQALGAQREQSQMERKSKKIAVSADELADASWHGEGTRSADNGGNGAGEKAHDVSFVGYDRTEADTVVLDFANLADGRVAVMLRETPFYAESGGQISDTGLIEGEGWKVEVDEVRKIDGRVTAIGEAKGEVRFGPAHAIVPRRARLDTERNHTATHLLHAALREVLGDHVHQAGSLVAPDRLRFDFAHHGPMTDDEIARVEEIVNRGVFDAIPLDIRQKSYSEAVASGAMALFGEKYGDVVRVVNIPGVSAELCGGTHVRNTAEIGLFRIVAESGIAAGVRRIEAITGPRAYELLSGLARTVEEIGALVRASPDTVVKKVHSLVDERKALEKRVALATQGSTDTEVDRIVSTAEIEEGVSVVTARVTAADIKSFTSLADAVRDRLVNGVAVLAADVNGKHTLLCVVTDDLREKGLRADAILREVAALAGGRGGGKAHLAQAGIPDASRISIALEAVAPTVKKMIAANGR